MLLGLNTSGFEIKKIRIVLAALKIDYKWYKQGIFVRFPFVDKDPCWQP